MTTWAQTSFVGSTSDPFDYFGYACGLSSDLDGDGVRDLVVGAYGANNDAGAVFGYPGGPSGIDPTREQGVSGGRNAFLGVSVSADGDVDGDGFDDVLLPDNATGSTRVLYGGPHALGAGRTDEFGSYPYAQAYAGDLDGDGFSDVISLVSEALVLFSFGSASGIDPSRDQLVRTGVTNSSLTAYRVGALGDVNGDGYSDSGLSIVTRDTEYSVCDEGWMFVFYGSAAGIDDALTTRLAFGSYSHCRGASFADAGDLDGDGYADVVIGVRGTEILVARGSAAGLDPAYASIALEDLDLEISGEHLGSAGDLDGDGVPDLLVGTHASGVHGYLLPGDPAVGYDLSAAQQIPSDSATRAYPVFAVGDVDADSDEDIAICAGEDSRFGSYAGVVVVLTNPAVGGDDTGGAGDTGGTGDTDETSDTAETGATEDTGSASDSGDGPLSGDDDSGEGESVRGCSCAAGPNPSGDGGWSALLAAAVLARRGRALGGRCSARDSSVRRSESAAPDVRLG